MYERTFRLIPTIIVSLLCWCCAERDINPAYTGQNGTRPFSAGLDSTRVCVGGGDQESSSEGLNTSNDLFRQNTRYIKERSDNMPANIIFSVILIFFAVLVMTNRSHIRAIKTEMKEQRKDRTGIKSLSSDIMITRFRLLNAIFASWIENNGSLGTRISNTLNKTVEDRQSFMSSLLIAFETEYPQYIEYLRSHDLNEDEMNIACLYTIGLSCKSIINYT